MRISYWSSDVCSSDLLLGRHNLADHTDALSASPYVPPRFDLQLFSRSEVELGRITSRQIVGVKAGPRDRGSQIVTENPGKQGRPDNVIGRTVDDHVLIACGGVRLLRRNEGRSDISEICSHGLCSKDRRAVGDRSGRSEEKTY